MSPAWPWHDGSGARVAYLSDQTHASIARGLRGLGFGPDQIRVLDSDGEFRLGPAVAAAVAADRAAGRRPAIVVATAGSTNCGAVDRLPALADLCKAERLWLHVDGAYGAPAALCDAGRDALTGISRADSLVVDPHKWLFQPYGVGCVLVMRPGALDETFAMSPEYLADVTARPGEVDFRGREPRAQPAGASAEAMAVISHLRGGADARCDRTRHRARGACAAAARAR
jgi:glutamate/tyrosine decarboxylase-like PLP-dependent enzyme